jgi:hypothetical protein
VTQLEIDTMRTTVEDVLDLFRQSVLPAMREQDGYAGVMAMSTSEGKAVVVSLWADEAAAAARDEGSWYDTVLADFATFFRAPPGREHYEVLLADLPTPVT